MRVAVIGAGIAGLATAWLLERRFEVTVFEAAQYIGGHVNTVDLELEDGPVAVDTGFIVYNEDTYPNLVRLFAELEVVTAPTTMSFAVSLGRGQLEYAGTRYGFLAQRRNFVRPAFWGMLLDIDRFNSAARQFIATPEGGEPTLREFVAAGRYGRWFEEGYLYPMAGAIWSAPRAAVLAFPARRFLAFFANHGLLRLRGQRRWRTVRGGAREYVARLARSFVRRVQTDAAVVALQRHDLGVTLIFADGRRQLFERVVMACHADQALAILSDATPRERRVLGGFKTSANHGLLHSDPALMPQRRAAWGAWNYVLPEPRHLPAQASVSYWMNRLQPLPTRTPLFVTLNPHREPARELTHRELSYRHPVLDQAALEAQALLPTIQGCHRVWFAGAWQGNGFHEDGLVAALRVARAFGVAPPWCGSAAGGDAAAGLPERAVASPA